jgi:hypothetical protein
MGLTWKLYSIGSSLEIRGCILREISALMNFLYLCEMSLFRNVFKLRVFQERVLK